MGEWRNKLHRWTGVDRPVGYTVAGRAWSLVSGPVTILLVTQFLTAESQGYYYTFGSVMALQVFLELGLSQCIVQFASHEFAHLSFRPGGRLEGDPRARTRLLSLGRLSLKWYGVMACLLVAGVGAGGHCFFWITSDSSVSWAGPWWCLCFTAGLALTLLPIGALLEGCNQLAFLYGLRTLAAILASVAIWLALWAGAGLFAGAIAGLATLCLTLIAYGRRWPGLLTELRQPPGEGGISWRHEIWPFQWKIAVSWMSGYFIFNLFNPVLFYFHGPVVAGQMGATLALTNSLNVMAASWTSTKGPRMGVLISQRRYGELDRLFFVATAQAVGVCVVGGVVLLLGLMFVRGHFAFGARFLGLAPTILLVLATVVNQVVAGQAIYLRAHKKEPFLWLSLANGLATGLLVVGLGRSHGAWGVCLGYMLVQMVIVVWATLVWRRCRRSWHQAEATTSPTLG